MSYSEGQAGGDWSYGDGESQSWGTDYASNGSYSNASAWQAFENPPLPGHIRLFGAIIGCVICTMGLFGNILLCVAVALNKSLRTTANSFIFSLAVADIIKLAAFIPLNIHTFRVGEWEFGGIGCLVQVVDFSFVSLVVTFHVIIITLCRYLLIVWPHVYAKVSGVKYVSGAFVVVYCVPLALAVRRLVGTMLGGYEMNVDVFFINSALVCVFTREAGSIMSVVYGILAMFGVILYMYGHIWVTVRRSGRVLQQGKVVSGGAKKGGDMKKGDMKKDDMKTGDAKNGDTKKGGGMKTADTKTTDTKTTTSKLPFTKTPTSKKAEPVKPRVSSTLRRELKLAQSMVVVMVIFLLTTLPGPVIFQISMTGVNVPSEVTVCGILLSWMFHCSNWLVYGLMNQQFRTTYISILRLRPSNRITHVTSVTQNTVTQNTKY